MVSRSGSCADCGASVVLTSAVPAVRAGAVVLLCASCGGKPSRRPAPKPAEDDEYDDLVISAEPAEEGEYDDLVVSAEPAEGGEETEPSSQRGNVVHSEGSPAVSGSIDTDDD